MQASPRGMASTPGGPNLGRGWSRLVDAVSQTVPPEEIGRIWVFPPMRREDREWGTAVVSRQLDDDRVAVYTARSVVIVRGKERGQGRVEVEEVGQSPIAVVHEVIRGVQERSGEPEPPVEVDPAMWFGRDDDEPAAES